mmetsp:Transcript_18163/g.58441  ORF Transcript_18163/g.58441 Transcript_18163/m.58441 type:complete len:207 (-) Transcript_18163:126-746(-)
MVLTPTTSIRLAATRLCPGRLARGLASTAAGSSHPHLVVLLHGLHGEPSDMAFLHRRLLQGGHGRLHVLSAATAGDQTDGIDAAGPRVTREIEAACDAIGPSGLLSIVAHYSNGGLVGRWALGELACSSPRRRREGCLSVGGRSSSPHARSPPRTWASSRSASFGASGSCAASRASATSASVVGAVARRTRSLKSQTWRCATRRRL